MRFQKRRCWVPLFLIVFFALSCAPTVSALEVSAKSAVLMECDSGAVLFEKNGDLRLPMASTTKMMTALIALEHGNLQQLLTIDPAAVGIEGSSLYLQPGEQMTLYQLLCGLMLHSGNDAAAAVAMAVGGTEARFVAMMNQKAKELGLSHTSFENPSGLDGELHYTTARDFADLARYAMKNPVFAEIVCQEKAVIPYQTNGKRYLSNHNKLLRIYDGAIGIKTGFTKKAGRCLVSAAQRNGVSLVAVTLAAPNDWNDHIRLFDAGFAGTQRKTLARPGDVLCHIPLYSSRIETVAATLAQEVTVTLRADGTQTMQTVVEAPRFLYGGITAGECIGRVSYYADGLLLRRTALLAGADCPPSEAKPLSLWEKLLNFLGK